MGKMSNTKAKLLEISKKHTNKINISRKLSSDFTQSILRRKTKFNSSIQYLSIYPVNLSSKTKF